MKEKTEFPAKKDPKIRKPRKLTESYFYNSAVYYLQRYASTVAQLRRVLQRKITRAQMRGDDVPVESMQWIEKAVEKCVTLGFVNDKIFTEQKIITLQRQGRAKSFITTKLHEKGVDKKMISDMLVTDEETEMNAALRTVKRKRLGQDQTPEGRQKDLGKLCRAGFSFDVANRALNAVKTGD